MVAYSGGRPVQKTITFGKTADESVTSSTTLQDDDDLVDIPLEEDGIYALQACLHFDAAANGPGVQFRFVLSAASAAACGIIAHASDSGGNSISDSLPIGASSTTGSTFANSAAMDESADPTFMIHGIIHANGAADSTLKLQWAQNTSDANALTLKKGSWIALTRIT